jgi:hypothetical protein
MNWYHRVHRFSQPWDIGEALGGVVGQNFTRNSAGFQNACALRLSYALNKCSFYIPGYNPFPDSSVFCSEKWEVISDAIHLETVYQEKKIPSAWDLNNVDVYPGPGFGRPVGSVKSFPKKIHLCYQAPESVKLHYIFRQKLMKFYLELIFGKACVTIDTTTATPGSKIDLKLIKQHIEGKQGIIVYECPYVGATGHCDLWDRNMIPEKYDGNPFPDGITKFLFWELP